MQSLARSKFSLAEDYPEPLTETQRNAFQRYLFSELHRYKQVNKTFILIQKGRASLEKITSRLQSEKLYLTSSLDKVAEPPKVDASNPPPLPRPSSVESSASSTGSSRVRRRGFGRLAMIQSALHSAEEEEASRSEVAAQREKIAREIRLRQVEKDLEEHRPHYDLLQSKYTWCSEEVSKRRNSLTPLLSLYHEMLLYEPTYASAFFLRAVGGTAVENGVAAVTFREVPFQPAVMTSSAEAIVRAQIEEVLNGYEEYRSRMDGVLARLDEEQQQKKAERIGELLGLIGSGGREEMPLTATENPAESTAAGLLEISDSNEEEEDGEGDEVDRRLVESALTALDDFQDLY